MKAKYIICLLFLSVLMVSCRGKHKNQENPKPSDNSEASVTNLKRDASDVALAEKVYKSFDDFSTLETQFKLQIPERNLTASGTLRIAKDSVIWLYIKALGFEVARAKFTQDSVFAVVKLKNQFYRGDYSLVRKFLPVAADFNILQSVLINKMFIVPDNKIENLDYFSMSMTDSTTLELSTLPNENYVQKFKFNNIIRIDSQNSKMTYSRVDYPEKNFSVVINYSDYQQYDGHLLPNVTQVSVGESVFTMSTTKAIFGKNLSFPLSIPDSYKPFEF